MSCWKISLLLAIGVVLSFSPVVFSQPANVYNFGPDVEITEAPPEDGSCISFLSSGQHFIAFRGDTVYVVWAESRVSTPPVGNHVLFAKSTNKGLTFGSNVRVNSTAAGFVPSMKVDSAGVIYVAYYRQGDIYFTKSTDGGNSFTPAVQVVDSAGQPYFQGLPAVAVNNKAQVFIAWIDYRVDDDSSSIFVSASYDGGQTFETNVNVDTTLKYRSGCDISCDDNGHVYVVYEELLPEVRQIIQARSSDSGRTFDYLTYVSDVPMLESSCCAVNPSVALGNSGQVAVVWEDSRFDVIEQQTLRFSVSGNFGQTFSPSIRVDDDADLSRVSSPRFPSLVWNRNVFYVAWGESRWDSSTSLYLPHIFFSYSVDGGRSFLSNLSIFDTRFNVNADAGFPGLCVNEQGQAFVAWQDDRHDPFFSQIWHLFGAAGIPVFIKGI